MQPDTAVHILRLMREQAARILGQPATEYRRGYLAALRDLARLITRPPAPIPPTDDGLPF
jgi:hypothetical protein